MNLKIEKGDVCDMKVTAYSYHSYYDAKTYYVASLCGHKGCRAVTFETKEAMFKRLDEYKEAGHEFVMSYVLIDEWRKLRERTKRSELGRIVFEFLSDNDHISIVDVCRYFSAWSLIEGEFADDFLEWGEVKYKDELEKEGG